jgi:hypothetical protein
MKSIFSLKPGKSIILGPFICLWGLVFALSGHKYGEFALLFLAG